MRFSSLGLGKFPGNLVFGEEFVLLLLIKDTKAQLSPEAGTREIAVPPSPHQSAQQSLAERVKGPHLPPAWGTFAPTAPAGGGLDTTLGAGSHARAGMGRSNPK